MNINKPKIKTHLDRAAVEAKIACFRGSSNGRASDKQIRWSSIDRFLRAQKAINRQLPSKSFAKPQL